MTSASDDADRPSFNGHPGQPVPSYPSPQAIPPQTRRLSSTVTNRTTHSPTQELSRIRSSHQTASSLSEDPERPRQPQPPSPAPPEANAPPPAEEVTPLRLGAHYSGLVLASMLGTLIRLGLGALATCER